MLRYGFGKHLTRTTSFLRLESQRPFAAAFAASSWLRVFSKFSTMPKRKSSAALAQPAPKPLPGLPPQAAPIEGGPPWPKRRASARKVSRTEASMNPDENANVLDGPEAYRASPDADTKDERMDLEAVMDVDKKVKDEDDSVPSLVTNGDSDSPLSDLSEMGSPIKPKPPPAKPAKKGAKAKAAPTTAADERIAPTKAKKEAAKESRFLDPEADGEEEADEEEIQEALSRPPPVNSDYLPLPWTGRLGYVSRLEPAALAIH